VEVLFCSGQAQAQTDGSDGPCSPHCDQVKVVGESSSSVLDRIVFFYKRMGLAVEGREMELLSLLASLETINNKGNQFVNERGGDLEGGVKNIV